VGYQNRCVLHDIRAAAEKPAGAVGKLHGEDEIAHAAVAEAARPAEPRGHGAAAGRARVRERRIEREILPALRECRADFAQRRAREGCEDEFP